MSLDEIQNDLKSIKDNQIKIKNDSEHIQSDSQQTNNTTDSSATDISINKIKKFEEFIDSKIVNMYARPWNKLEIKLKKKKITEYFENLFNIEEITQDEKKENIEKFTKELDLNRKIKVKYDIVECCITDIK